MAANSSKPQTPRPKRPRPPIEITYDIPPITPAMARKIARIFAETLANYDLKKPAGG